MKKDINIIIVGDHIANKKRQFLQKYADTKFPTDHFVLSLRIDGEKIKLGLWDTTGMEKCDRLRHQYYFNKDLFIFMFDKKNNASFENISTMWYPEKEDFSPKTPCVLVGIQGKPDPGLGLSEIKDEEIKSLAGKIKAKNYFICDFNNDLDVRNFFNNIIRSYLNKEITILPPFLKAFAFKNKVAKITEHMKKTILVAQGSRQEDSPFSKLPTEVLLNILLFLGAHLTPDETFLSYLSYFNSLIVANVHNSSVETLFWKRSITLKDEKNTEIQIFPYRHKSNDDKNEEDANKRSEKCIVM
jgi:Ras-related C3 botulinum toxin substrate 1